MTRERSRRFSDALCSEGSLWSWSCTRGSPAKGTAAWGSPAGRAGCTVEAAHPAESRARTRAAQRIVAPAAAREKYLHLATGSARPAQRRRTHVGGAWERRMASEVPRPTTRAPAWSHEASRSCGEEEATVRTHQRRSPHEVAATRARWARLAAWRPAR